VTRGDVYSVTKYSLTTYTLNIFALQEWGLRCGRRVGAVESNALSTRYTLYDALIACSTTP
jgi:hypothetical protein